MSEFGGLRKNKKTQYALVGLGSAALAAAVALPRAGGPNFPKRIIKWIRKKKNVGSKPEYPERTPDNRLENRTLEVDIQGW